MNLKFKSIFILILRPQKRVKNIYKKHSYRPSKPTIDFLEMPTPLLPWGNIFVTWLEMRIDVNTKSKLGLKVILSKYL